MDGFARAWPQAIEWASDEIYEAGAKSAYADGFMAGRLEAHTASDEAYNAGYRDGLADNADVVRRLRERVAELEAAS
jgi:hypothetical protein